VKQATSEGKRERSKGCRVEGGKERGRRSGEEGAAVQPAILSNQSLEPCTCPHLSWTDRYRVQDKCRPRHRGSFRRGQKRGREEHEGVKASGGGVAGRRAWLLVPDLSLKVLEAAAQLRSVRQKWLVLGRSEG
jgi:hypothetical protein